MSTTGSQKQMPKDALVMYALLKEMGVEHHEPRLINQMMEFIYRYVTQVLEEARVYSNYARKKVIDIEDIKLALTLVTEKTCTTVPPREMLMDLVKIKNTTPLPLIKPNSGLRLPPDRFCTTQPNYRLKFYKKAIASTPSATNIQIRLPGSVSTSGIFKAPSHLPPRPSPY